MSLNCNEIDVILDELDLSGSFIQDVVQPGFDTLAFYTYKAGRAKTVLVCTAAGSCRIHETRRKITRNAKPLRFMEFLNAHIRGAKITGVGQIAKERVIKLDLVHAGEQFVMFVRLWSNAANVILCDSNNTILDCLYRRPKKNEIAGAVFSLPEIKPDEDSSQWKVRDFSERAEKNAELAEISPSPDNDSLALDTRSLTLNEKVDLWYGEHAASLSREAILLQAEKWYEAQKSKRETALAHLQKKQMEFENAEQLKHQGDLILAYAHLISSDKSFLECTDYEDGSTVRIKLDAKKSAQANAENFYKQYKKALSGKEKLAFDIVNAQKEIELLEKTYAQICAEQNPVRLEQLFRKTSTPRQQQKKTHPGLLFHVDGWQIYVGRDAGENDELLRHFVRGNDTWLHVRDFSGGYVFIKAQSGKTVPLEILLQAGNLAVYYSKARKAGRADLYYTQVKYLRRAKNGPKGLVLPTHEKNLSITLDEKKMMELRGL